MANLTKLLIAPYFGKFPLWIGNFTIPKGYDLLLDCDLEGFKKRVMEKLDIECPIIWGTGKVWDYRCTLGLLYEEELKDYDFWGHVDFDVVFGDVNSFLPDSLLSELDVYSGHNTYVNGCFSLFRNSRDVNNLFTNYPEWKSKMTHPVPNGWVEYEYSRTLEQSGLRYRYTWEQGNPYDYNPILKKENGKLYQDIDHNGTWTEIMFHHFRRTKKYPL